MRVLRLLLTMSLLVGLVAGVGFVTFREVVLRVAAARLISAADSLETLSSRAGEYVDLCLQKGALGSTARDAFAYYQVRFVSPTEYQVEGVCLGLARDPVVLSTHELPIFVRLVPGTSGFVYGVQSQVQLESLGRRLSVAASDWDVRKISAAPLPAEPLTSCSGYGYTCCPLDATVGVGEPYAQALDCPKTCHASCQSRPLVVTFVTDPYPDNTTRTTRISRNQVVRFIYTIQADSPVTGWIETGDGGRYQLGALSGTQDHRYQCSQPSCQFTASIVATDAFGISSARTVLATLTVVAE